MSTQVNDFANPIQRAKRNNEIISNLVDTRFAKNGIPVVTGKRGRRYTHSIEDVANDYLVPFPAPLLDDISENIELIGGLLDALVAARRSLTEEESLYISKGRDAQAMTVLNGEPNQVDVFTRFLVSGRRGVKIGTIFQRRVKIAIQYAQSEANELNRTLYVIVQRYSVERNLRDALTASKHGAPASAVGLMSKNIFAIIVTDNSQKTYKGQIATVATCSPEAPFEYETDNENDNAVNFQDLQALIAG